MANPEHVAKLNSGVHDWNKWRKENPVLGEDLRQGGVKEFEQHKIDLRHARLEKKDLRGFDLSFADLHRATLWHSDLSGANLEGADLSSVNLNFANLSGANLRGAILRFSRLAEADVSESLFSGSFVYASSIWNLKGQPKEQIGIVITPRSEPEITVDNLEVAQFIYLLLNNPKVRQVIDTIGKKAVLILGRFTPERKAVLNSISHHLAVCAGQRKSANRSKFVVIWCTFKPQFSEFLAQEFDSPQTHYIRGISGLLVITPVNNS